MFRRHCVVVQILKNQPISEHILFVDADMAVINPNHLLEDFIPGEIFDLVFYERIFNGEIMAGSYFARQGAHKKENLCYLFKKSFLGILILRYIS